MVPGDAVRVEDASCGGSVEACEHGPTQSDGDTVQVEVVDQRTGPRHQQPITVIAPCVLYPDEVAAHAQDASAGCKLALDAQIRVGRGVG